jgi:hypothetical protein
MNIVIDSMQSQDWEFVRAIYLEGISTGQATFETEAPDWERWDAGHLPQCRLVARNGGVLGFAALSPVSRREVYARRGRSQRLRRGLGARPRRRRRADARADRGLGTTGRLDAAIKRISRKSC